MKIIAKRGNSQYLVTKSNEVENPPSYLVDLSQNLSTEMPAQQALKWGYWEEAGELSLVILNQIKALVG